jgi:hypothetical protein
MAQEGLPFVMAKWSRHVFAMHGIKANALALMLIGLRPNQEQKTTQIVKD